jgi:outer membrane receptor for ferrienterochelin and colicins
MRMGPWKLLAAALLALLASTSLSAQQGTLIGRITLEGGVPVPALAVEVIGQSSTLTNDQGQYRFALPPGTYDLYVRSGINSRERRIDNITVTAGQTTTLDIVLATRVQELDAIVVTSSRGREERQTQSVATSHSISSIEIEERPAQTLADHLRTAPGVDVITQGVQSTNVTVRGFNNIFSGALHMLTDHRLAGVPSLRVNLMHFVPTTEQDVDRMEVVLGPGSALYGPNTANGVVHVLTKSPLDAPGTTVTLGSGYRTVGRTQGVFQPPEGQSLFQGSFRSAWAFSDQLGLKVSGQYLKGYEWPYLDATEEAARLQALNNRTACVNDKLPRGLNTTQANAVCDRVGIRDFEIERWGGEVRGDWRFADDGSVVATYGRTDATGIELTGLGAGQTRNWIYQFYQMRLNKGRFFGQAYYNTSDAGDTYLLQSGMPLVDESGMFVGQLQHGLSVLGGRQDFTYGFDYFGTRPKTNGTINGIYENDDNIDEWGIYLQSKTALTERLDLVLAGRMDDHSLLSNKVWSPRAGLVFRPVEQQSIRLSYNRAFSTPSSLNYFLDISGGLAPNPLGQLGYGVRAFGTGKDGWSLQPGGTTQMRSPFINNGTTLTPPPDASALWLAAVNVLFAAGQIDLATRNYLIANPPPAGSVPWMLFDTNTSQLQTLAGATLPAVDPVRESYTESVELGWTGIVQNRVSISADVYYMKKNDFVSPLIVQTPLFMMNGPAVIAHLTTLAGVPPSARVPLGTGLAQVPLGVVSSAEANAQGAELIATYRNVGDVSLWGGDVALEWFLTDNWTVTGAYSWVSEDYFEIEDGDPIALNAPRHKGSLGLAYRDLRRGFTGATRVRFNNEFPAESAGYVGTACVTGAPLGLFDEDCVEAAAIMDVNFSWRVPTTDATLQLVVNNVFNSAYRSFVGVPAVRRMGFLSVRYQLF